MKYTDDITQAKWFPNKTSAYAWAHANKKAGTDYLVCLRVKGKRDGYCIFVYVGTERKGYLKHAYRMTRNKEEAIVFPSSRQAEAFRRSVKIEGYDLWRVWKNLEALAADDVFLMGCMQDNIVVGYVTEEPE